jgi:hypothetical protein
MDKEWESQYLITPKDVKAILTKHDPSYGANFTDAEWGAIGMRIEQLLQVIVSMYERDRRSKSDAPKSDTTT